MQLGKDLDLFDFDAASEVPLVNRDSRQWHVFGYLDMHPFVFTSLCLCTLRCLAHVGRKLVLVAVAYTFF